MTFRHYPPPAAEVGRVESAPRRVRGYLDGALIFDTTRARYLWEFEHYPQYSIPVSDIAPGLLRPTGCERTGPGGSSEQHDLVVGDTVRSDAVRVYGAEATPGLEHTARFEWDALDAWFEEDEQIFVHPRNPYSRLDTVRASRRIRIEVEGVVLAETPSCVIAFETGLPPRYYLPRTAVRFEHLIPSGTRTSCPYKGTTSAYWSVRAGKRTHSDLAWSYDFPVQQASALAGLIAFYDEKVDVYVDGERQERPATHFH